jgi:hypothetical protein
MPQSNILLSTGAAILLMMNIRGSESLRRNSIASFSLSVGVLSFAPAMLSVRSIDNHASIFLSLHFDAGSFSHAFEHDVDRLYYVYLRVRFAVHNNFMFGFFAVSYNHALLLCEPVVPTAVPFGEPIGVALRGVGELRTCQSLNVKESFGISIGAETHLRFGT